MRISCCSRAMSSQTQISLGNPQVSQIMRRSGGWASRLGTSLGLLLLAAARGARLADDAVAVLVLDGKDAGDLTAQRADLSRVRGRTAHGLDAALLHEFTAEFGQAHVA